MLNLVISVQDESRRKTAEWRQKIIVGLLMRSKAPSICVTNQTDLQNEVEDYNYLLSSLQIQIFTF